MTIWFETHATSIDNECGLASGQADSPLSELGRRQAVLVGHRSRARQVSRVYTSDLSRARETAEIAFADSPVPVMVDTRLRECDYGTWSRRPVEELDAVRIQFLDERFPGGESYRDVAKRMMLFFETLPRSDGQVLLIGHRATWFALEHLLRQRDLHEVLRSGWRWQPGWSYTAESMR